MPVVTCIEDLRQMSKKRVARAIFEYVDCGSYDQSTLRANRADLERIALRQRVGIDVDNRSTRASMLGEPVTIQPPTEAVVDIGAGDMTELEDAMADCIGPGAGTRP